MSGAAGFKRKLDPPLIHVRRRGLGDYVHRAPLEVHVVDDARLRLVLALYREAMSSDSPFYRFLQFWNALDAAFDNDEPQRDAFVNAREGIFEARHLELPPGQDWATFLRDSYRNAAAHAVRHRPGAPVLDPDRPEDRGRLHGGAEALEYVLRDRIDERWDQFAIHEARRD